MDVRSHLRADPLLRSVTIAATRGASALAAWVASVLFLFGHRGCWTRYPVPSVQMAPPCDKGCWQCVRSHPRYVGLSIRKVGGHP